MREVKRKKVRVIDGTSAADFENALNAVLREIKEPEIMFDTNRPLLAYVTYDEYEMIPESVRDAYEMRGETHYCGQCPYFRPSQDKRIKHVTCELGERTRVDRCACELFYKLLNNGEIKAGDYKVETRKIARMD